MKNPICVSTGAVYKLTSNPEDINSKIKKLKTLPIDGIEVSFAFPQYISDFKISQENLEYLKKLKIKSIHSPWKEIEYNEKSKPVLEKIELLYNQIGANNVVFHKTDNDALPILKQFNFNSSIENECWIKKPNTAAEINKILNENPHLKFTFDFAHAISISNQTAQEFLKNLKDKIIQIHISYLDQSLTSHTFLFKHDSSEIKSLLKQIPKNIPLVLECCPENKEEFSLLKKEIQYLRSI